jgi:hypothetical protein
MMNDRRARRRELIPRERRVGRIPSARGPTPSWIPRRSIPSAKVSGWFGGEAPWSVLLMAFKTEADDHPPTTPKRGRGAVEIGHLHPPQHGKHPFRRPPDEDGKIAVRYTELWIWRRGQLGSMLLVLAVLLPLQIRSVVTKFDQYSSRSSDQAAAEESEVGREEALQTKGIAR